MGYTSEQGGSRCGGTPKLHPSLVVNVRLAVVPDWYHSPGKNHDGRYQNHDLVLRTDTEMPCG